MIASPMSQATIGGLDRPGSPAGLSRAWARAARALAGLRPSTLHSPVELTRVQSVRMTDGQW